jgi:HSP20 family protein
VEPSQIQETIEQVERLYTSVTGHDVPPASDAPYATIPPERDPEQYVAEQIERLLATLGPSAVAFRAGGASAEPAYTPPVAIWEDEEGVVVCVDLPGTSRSEVKVEMKDGSIVVRGRRRKPRLARGKAAVRWAEQPSSTFVRTIPVSAEQERAPLKAEMRDGVLEIRLPRAHAASKTIPVE